MEPEDDLNQAPPSEDDEKFYTPPPPTGQEGDARQRLSEYLKTQMQRGANQSSPEYQKILADNQGSRDQAMSNNSFASLLMNSAAKFGNIDGKAPDSSDFDKFSNQMNQQLAASGANGDRLRATADQQADRQAKLYQYMTDIQRQQNSEKVAQMNAETKRLSLQNPSYQGSPIVDPLTGKVQILDKKTGQMVDIGQTGVKPEKDDWRESDKVDAQGNPLIYNPKTGQYKSAGGANGVAVHPKEKAGDKPNADQFKAAGFSKRMEQAEDVMGRLEKAGYNRADEGTSLKSMLPGFLQGESQKSQEQAERNFINAVLRRESGAAIGKDEFTSAEKQYLPRAGDTAQVLAQKKANRQQAIETMKAEGGPAYAQIPSVSVPDLNQVGSGTATAAPGFKPLHQMTREEKLQELQQLTGGQ